MTKPRVPLGTTLELRHMQEIRQAYHPLRQSKLFVMLDDAEALLRQRRDAARLVNNAGVELDRVSSDPNATIQERLNAAETLRQATATVEQLDRRIVDTVAPMNDLLEQIDAVSGRVDNRPEFHSERELQMLRRFLNETVGDRDAKLRRKPTEADRLIAGVLDNDEYREA